MYVPTGILLVWTFPNNQTESKSLLLNLLISVVTATAVLNKGPRVLEIGIDILDHPPDRNGRGVLQGGGYLDMSKFKIQAKSELRF